MAYAWNSNFSAEYKYLEAIETWRDILIAFPGMVSDNVWEVLKTRFIGPNCEICIFILNIISYFLYRIHKNWVFYTWVIDYDS